MSLSVVFIFLLKDPPSLALQQVNSGGGPEVEETSGGQSGECSFGLNGQNLENVFLFSEV